MTDEVIAAATLPSLAETIRHYGLDPRKSLGQNFLLDPRLTAKIAGATGDLNGVQVIEVGPGPGGLTRALLATNAAEIVVIERDERCLAALAELAAAHPGRLRIIPGDALKMNLAELVPAPRQIVANLPYNIATPLLTGWLSQIRAYQQLTLMFQKEVAERLTAVPNSKSYGRLSILTQWLTEPRIRFHIPPGAFFPPPKVTSSVVTFEPRQDPLAPANQADLEQVTAAAFGQRRKMLRSSLKALGVDIETLLAGTGIEPTARAETLNVTQFCALARAFAALATCVNGVEQTPPPNLLPQGEEGSLGSFRAPLPLAGGGREEG